VALALAFRRHSLDQLEAGINTVLARGLLRLLHRGVQYNLAR
jgi:hypothetical protein